MSEVSIANRALQKLGEGSIEALDQNHPNARSMNLAYAPVRDRLQRVYSWNFCKARASIAADSVKTLFNGLNRFEKPNNFLRLLRTKEIDGLDIRHDWQIEGNYVVTAESAPLEFRYLAKVTDTAIFDPLFAELLATVIAKETCLQVTGSNVREGNLSDDIKIILAEARLVNAYENDSEVPLEDDWVLAMR